MTGIRQIPGRPVILLAAFAASLLGAPSADAHDIWLTDVFGDQGRHVRAIVGVASLPFGAAVEIGRFLSSSAGRVSRASALPTG